MKYLCKECQTEFSDEGEANFHSYEVHSMEFEDCIQVVEEETLVGDSSEENPSEIDSMAEEELKDKIRAKLSVDAYMNGELTDTEEKMLISRLMGKASDKSVDKKAHDKTFARPVKTSEAFKEYYAGVIEKLQDESMIACPVCGGLWESLAKEETTILSDEKTKVGIPFNRIMHLKLKHEPIWNLIKSSFGVSAEAIPDARVSTTPNPENVSATNPEELSKEELAEVISESAELRKQFFRKWMKKLQDRD